ncbi:MAG: HAMP domain-containing sensor histidine kinase [Chitinophagales bacterium]|nr:HAMP domain-containing histidine kinase [Bacteroidota bacterium]
MNIYHQKYYWKIIIIVFAALIIVFTLLYNYRLAKRLSVEERRRIELVAEAFKHIVTAKDNDDLTFEFTSVQQNESIPIIIVDENDNVVETRNLDEDKVASDSLYVQNALAKMKNSFPPIEIVLNSQNKQYLYYSESVQLSQLRWYPYFQLGVITLFLLFTYLAFNTARRSEQNQVWVGMARETAHQIGTPLTSLYAWNDMLNEHEDAYIQGIGKEMTRDLERLELIADRFSKIGSVPKLEIKTLNKSLQKTFNYVHRRASSKIVFENNFDTAPAIKAPISAPLLDWVVENLLKNALDAMGESGKISLYLSETPDYAIVDISDTGKGIPRNDFVNVFKPGFSTKKRGWGLGLSLSKRIIEEYHKGKLFVHHSVVGKGTTFRIMLRKEGK